MIVMESEHLHMSERENPYSRKRKRSENPLPSPPSSKRIKYQSYSEVFPPKFWDNLSKIWLTKNALKELTRRNKKASLRRFTRSDLRRTPPSAQQSTLSTTTLGDTKYCCAIKRFSRRGGPDLLDIIGHPEPAVSKIIMSSSQSTSHRKAKGRAPSSVSNTKTTAKTTPTRDKSGKSRSTKASGPEDRNFEQNLKEVGVYQYGYEFPDGNLPPVGDDWEEVNEALMAYRASLSPSRFSDSGYQKLVREDAKALDENDVTSKVLPAMLQAMGASNGAQGNKRFNDIERLTDANTKAQPDYYYGSNPDQLDPVIRKELKRFIAPQPGLPIAPNFFLEAKGPNGSAAVVKRQSSHNGAIGARAIHALETYGEEISTYDNTTMAISSSYQDGQLKLYSHSVAQPDGAGTRPDYYMKQLNSWSMTGNKKSFLEGARAYKNALDMTEGWRNDAITHANSVLGHGADEENEDDLQEIDLYEQEDLEEANTEAEDEPESEGDVDAGWDGVAPHLTSFAHLTDSTLHSALVEEDEDGEEVQLGDTETSMDELAMEYVPPPAKRGQNKSHKSGREKRQFGTQQPKAKSTSHKRSSQK